MEFEILNSKWNYENMNFSFCQEQMFLLDIVM